jgi:hypothetical protein
MEKGSVAEILRSFGLTPAVVRFFWNELASLDSAPPRVARCQQFAVPASPVNRRSAGRDTAHGILRAKRAESCADLTVEAAPETLDLAPRRLSD